MQKKRYYYFLLLAACIMGVVWAVTNIGYDATYQISMGYRLAQGDTMFLEMWEPHQTSAFLCAILIKLFIAVTGTTTGVVLFLQFVGIFIRGGISIYFFCVFKKYMKAQNAFFIAYFFFIISPKDYALPDFSNMQLWFSALLMLSLIRFFQDGKRRNLAIAIISLCLAILSYPSCLILFPICIILILRYSPSKPLKSAFIFIMGCIFIGILYSAVIIFCSGGMEIFISVIKNMLALEPSHTESVWNRLFRFIKDFVELLPLYIVVLASGYLVKTIARRRNPQMSKITTESIGLLTSSFLFCVLFFFNILSVHNRCWYGSIMLAVMVFSMICNIRERKNNLWEGRNELKCIYYVGVSIGFGCIFATLMMTDLPLVTAIPYGLIAFMVSLIPLFIKYDEIDSTITRRSISAVFIAFIFLFLFRGLYIRTPIEGEEQIICIKDDLSIIKKGPAWGIITDESSSAIERDSVNDFIEYISPGSKIWIINSLVNSLGYLYADTEIAAPTVMSTPFYCDSILEYWKLNPDKEPDVVAVYGYLGQVDQSGLTNEWVMEWIENIYRPSHYVNTTYYRLYYK